MLCNAILNNAYYNIKNSKTQHRLGFFLADTKNHWRDVKTTDDIPFDELESLFESSFQEIGSEKDKKKPLNTPLFDANSEVRNKGGFEVSKKRTSKLASPPATEKSKPANPTLGDQYKKEVEKVRGEYGDLEDIRRSLGLSKRRIALLLMVDPSAWTRWSREGGEAPPHIWRALQWYMILQSKHPEMSASLWLNTLVRPQIPPQELQKIKDEVLSASLQKSREEFDRELESLESLKRHTAQLKTAQLILGGLVGLHILLAMIWVLFLS